MPCCPSALQSYCLVQTGQIQIHTGFRIAVHHVLSPGFQIALWILLPFALPGRMTQTQAGVVGWPGGQKQQENTASIVSGPAQAAMLLVESAVEPVKAAAAAIGITGDPRIPAALPASLPSSEQSALPSIARVSPFAQGQSVHALPPPWLVKSLQVCTHAKLDMDQEIVLDDTC